MVRSGRQVSGERGSGTPAPARDALVEAGLLLAGELSLPVLLRRFVELAVSITRARYGALGVTGPGGRIVEFITVGLDPEQRRAIGPIPSGRGILGALIHDPRPLRLERLQDDPRSIGFPPNHPPMTTFLGAPVRARGQIFGNLYLTEKEGGQPFDGADEAALVTLATQAGVAIANAQAYQQLAQRERWLAALQEITSALLAGQPQEALMGSIARRARELAGADLAAIAVPLEPGSSALRVVAAAGRGSGRLLRAPARVSGTPSHRVMATGRPELLRGGDLGPTLVAGARIPVSTLMVVPLHGAGAVTGTLSLTLSDPREEFNPVVRELLESFAGQASLALDYARMQAHSLRLAVQGERRRIARDIHDEPVQALIHLARRLELLALEQGAEAPTGQLEEIRELAVAVVDGLRQLTEGLRSELLEQEGLASALRDLMSHFGARTGVRAEFSLCGAPERWDPELERNLFRLGQEALSNVERHAAASRVSARLRVRPWELELLVGDDGRGFRESGPGAARPGLGIIGMRERVSLCGGQLRFRSRPGHGTVLRVRVPIAEGQGKL